MHALTAAYSILFATEIPLYVVIYSIGALIERTRPVQKRQPWQDLVFDAAYAACHSLIVFALGPFVSVVAMLAVNAAGGGFIALRDDGLYVIPSVIACVLARDLLEYLFHRAQHAIPLLWEMHSLHHSEEAFNVMTGHREFWLVAPLKIALLYPLIGILFYVPVKVAVISGIVFAVSHFVAHLNLRVSLGPFTLLVANPKFHRIHHSLQPEHYNKNFSDLLPLWDVLFGTVWVPGKNEFPETGLMPRDKPTGLIDGLLWPLRSRRLTGSLPSPG